MEIKERSIISHKIRLLAIVLAVKGLGAAKVASGISNYRWLFNHLQQKMDVSPFSLI
jgi:hypothetical protein